MSIIFNALPEFLGALAAAATIGGVTGVVRQFRPRSRRVPASFVPPAPSAEPGVDPSKPTARRVTLLGTVTNSGEPVQLTTTRPAGTTITYQTGGLVETFELTDVPLYDGTFAAEPVNRYQ
jgi:hypothetical protein